MGKASDYMVVFVTASSQAEAELLSDCLVKNKLAACVNTLSVNSIFSWQNKIDKAKEILLIIKSKRKMFSKIENLVKKHHSYEVPEVIGLPLIGASQRYLDWIEENTL